MFPTILRTALLGSVALRMIMDGDTGSGSGPADSSASSAPDATAPKTTASGGDSSVTGETSPPTSPGDAPNLSAGPEGLDGEHDGPLPADGEHITQQMPTLSEAFGASGGNTTMGDIGAGSVTEEAPAVHSTVSDTERVVHQGDEVIVHGRAIIDGNTSMPGRVLKVNQDKSIAVRVLRATGQTFDVPGKVSNVDLGDGSFYWTWPPDGQEDTLPPAAEPGQNEPPNGD